VLLACGSSRATLASARLSLVPFATYLNVLAARDLSEVFLRLEGLVGAVVGGRGADDTETRLDHVSTLGEHEELAEERHGDQLAVQLRRHPGHFGETLAVEQPEPAPTNHSRQMVKCGPAGE